MRRFALFAVPPPAAATGIGVIDSTRPKPARSGAGAGGTTTAALAPGCGTTTA
jgi:hypothetical protein